MDRVKKGQMAEYLKEAKSWETSSVQTANKITRLAIAFGAGGLVIGVVGIGSVYAIANRPPPMPVVLWGDKSLGRVDQVQSLAEGKITVPEATDRYFAQLYVQYRESWDPEVARKYDSSKLDDERALGNYYRVALMSTDAEARRYEAWYRSDQSPLKLYGDNAKVSVRFRGTTFLRPHVALVRYTRVVEGTGIMQPQTSYHTATVTLSYSNGRMSERDRAINPFGFQAEYRTDPDVPDAAGTGAARQVAPQVPAPAPAPAALAAGPLDLRPLQVRRQ